MRTALTLSLVGLSVLVMGAHLLFHGQLVLVLLALALFALLWVRRPWAVRVLQVALLADAAEWVRTLVGSAAERQARGQPWLRMGLILGAVALVALAAAALLEHPRLRARFGRTGGAAER